MTGAASTDIPPDRMSQAASHPTVAAIVAVYGTALLIGLGVVSFPASGVFLMRTIGLSAADYGSIFLPQLATTIAGALLGAAASRRISQRIMLVIALVCFLLAELALLSSTRFDPAAGIAILMFGTGIFGFGFGFGGGPINAMAADLFPLKANGAILTLHGVAGLGFTTAPFAFGVLIAADQWQVGPIVLVGVALCLLFASLLCRLPHRENHLHATVTVSQALLHAGFRTAAAIVFLYALVEGTLANWILPFLQRDQGFDASVAAIVLSAFWGALTLGRLMTALFAAQAAPRRLLIVLSVILACALIAVPVPQTLVGFAIVFAFAGLGCSAFFPLLVALSSSDRPEAVSLHASLLTGIMMAGVGLGAFGVGNINQAVRLEHVLAAVAILPVIILAMLLVTPRARA